jgi:lipopolysaccharide/colanic/teichoic acid biosynthesis glycosyltransferase
MSAPDVSGETPDDLSDRDGLRGRDEFDVDDAQLYNERVHKGRECDGGSAYPTGKSPERRRISPAALRASVPLTDAMALTAVVVLAGFPLWQGAGYVGSAVVLLAAQGQHRLRICLRVHDQAPGMVVAGSLPVLLFGPALRGGAIITAVLAVAALVLSRSTLSASLRAARCRGFLAESTLLIGSGPLADQVAVGLAEHPELGLRVRALLDRRDAGSECAAFADPARLDELVRRCRATRVIVCLPEIADEELVALLRRHRRPGLDVCLVPRWHELGLAVPRSRLDEVWGTPLVPVRRSGACATSAAAKRGFDLVVGGVLLMLLSPVVLLLALAVRLRGGAAFFRQVRVSRGGELVRVVKLRTVSDGVGDGWSVGPEQSDALGRALRRRHLDELPQLVNVLRGQMSLVGPRPERPCYAERFARRIPHYDDRHRMPGGMTGWAQVHGLHGDTSIPDRARFDNQYVEYWSPWLDVVILARTAAIAVVASAPRRARSGQVRTAGGRGEGTACDHGARGRRRGAAAARDPAAHSPRRRGPRALQPR